MRMSPKEIEEFLDEHFPLARRYGQIIDVGARRLRLRLPYRPEFIRPGGIISGPTLMTLVDTAMYQLLLATYGPVTGAVTANMTMNFLRPAPPLTLFAEATLLRAGRRFAVGQVTVTSEQEPEAVAHATVTYALPRLEHPHATIPPPFMQK